MTAPTDFDPHPSWLGPPIDARPLFARESAELLRLLRRLRPSDWSRPAVPGWTVRDLAVHVLGDQLWRLGGRHGEPNGQARSARRSGETLEAFVHRTNQEWVDAHAGLGAAALVRALEDAAARVVHLFERSDPAAPSVGVSWAGADPAPMWLDCAREFTEYWTHRQQIRHAVDLPTDPEPHAMSLVLDTFMRALPHTLRYTGAPVGSRVRVVAEGPGGGSWTATATPERWSLARVPVGPPDADLRMDRETAWRLCTRGLEPDQALARARVRGDRRLAEAAGRIVSVIH